MYHLLVWVHVLTGTVWMGSMLFVYGVILPFMRRPEHAEAAVPLSHWVALRFRWLSRFSLLVLVTTGAACLVYRGFTWNDALGPLWNGPFGRALGGKLLLVAAMTGLSLIADFILVPHIATLAANEPGSRAESRLRMVVNGFGHLNVVASILIIGLAVVLVRGWPI